MDRLPVHELSALNDDSLRFMYRATDAANREAFLKALTHGSAVLWQHVNLLGEYDFSEERLQDTVGIKPPKLVD